MADSNLPLARTLVRFFRGQGFKVTTQFRSSMFDITDSDGTRVTVLCMKDDETGLDVDVMVPGSNPVTRNFARAVGLLLRESGLLVGVGGQD